MRPETWGAQRAISYQLSAVLLSTHVFDFNNKRSVPDCGLNGSPDNGSAAIHRPASSKVPLQYDRRPNQPESRPAVVFQIEIGERTSSFSRRPQHFLHAAEARGITQSGLSRRSRAEAVDRHGNWSTMNCGRSWTFCLLLLNVGAKDFLGANQCTIAIFG
jgi:hypothetical protein